MKYYKYIRSDWFDKKGNAKSIPLLIIIKSSILNTKVWTRIKYINGKNLGLIKISARITKFALDYDSLNFEKTVQIYQSTSITENKG